MESGKRHAATAARDITYDTGRKFGDGSTQLEDLVDHHGDGRWRRHDSPAVSNGGADEPRKKPDIMIIIGTNNVSRNLDEEEAQLESMMVVLFTTIWQKFKCAVLTTITLTPTGMRHNERVIRWNNIVSNLASRNAGRMILMVLQHELTALDQPRFTTDGINFDSIEGQAWMNLVFQERLDELEFEFFDTGVLRREETTNKPALATFVPPNPETRVGSVLAVPQLPHSSSEPGQERTYWTDWAKQQ